MEVLYSGLAYYRVQRYMYWKFTETSARVWQRGLCQHARERKLLIGYVLMNAKDCIWICHAYNSHYNIGWKVGEREEPFEPFGGHQMLSLTIGRGTWWYHIIVQSVARLPGRRQSDPVRLSEFCRYLRPLRIAIVKPPNG